MSDQPLERLRTRIEALGAPLALGVDPHPDRLPAALPRGVESVERFARELVAAVGEHVAAVKVNVAFFEAFGAAGWAALERVRGDVPDELVFVLDAKRGDIGTTAERYASAAFDSLDADAITLSPYLGADAVEPFLAHPGRLVYLLARTSNPSAGTFQDLVSGGQPLYEHVARWAADRWTDGRVGLVVGATAAHELERLRATVPGPAFLVPGVGAQGGDLGASVRTCHGVWAPGIVPISRAIAEASTGTDWIVAAAAAAEAALIRMREAGARLSA